MWFDESLKFKLCNATISGLVLQIAPCTASPFNPINIPETVTGIDGWTNPLLQRQ